MGTRGLHGFHVNGKTKVTYNQFDTYPGGIGLRILGELRDLSVKQMRRAAKSIRLVKDRNKKGNRNKVSEANQLRYAPLADLDMGWGGLEDWYCLLRQCQGTILPWITGECPVDTHKRLRISEKKSEYIKLNYRLKLDRPVQHMIGNADYANEAEWGYVVNLDSEMLEVYTCHGEAKPGDRPKGVLSVGDGEYGFKLVGEFPLSDLPTDLDFLCEIFVNAKLDAHHIIYDLSHMDECSHDRMMEVVKAAGCPMKDVIEALKKATPEGYEDNLRVFLSEEMSAL
jgi:hypothetical protein